MIQKITFFHKKTPSFFHKIIIKIHKKDPEKKPGWAPGDRIMFKTYTIKVNARRKEQQQQQTEFEARENNRFRSKHYSKL